MLQLKGARRVPFALSFAACPVVVGGMRTFRHRALIAQHTLTLSFLREAVVVLAAED